MRCDATLPLREGFAGPVWFDLNWKDATEEKARRWGECSGGG